MRKVLLLSSLALSAALFSATALSLETEPITGSETVTLGTDLSQPQIGVQNQMPATNDFVFKIVVNPLEEVVITASILATVDDEGHRDTSPAAIKTKIAQNLASQRQFKYENIPIG